MPTRIVINDPTSRFPVWEPSNLVKLGLLESDLERAIVAQPEALILDPIGMMQGSVKAFVQKRISATAGHRDIPDVVLLTDHGSVVVVEVKRLGNPDLRGRDVVAQALGYAASLTSLSEDAIVSMLSNRRFSSWNELCADAFPKFRRPEQLAEKFLHRFRDAEIDIVVACDEAPSGLADWVRAAGQQKAAAFNFHVVEITPLTQDGSNLAAWCPRSALQTEIVHRTVVTVRMAPGVPAQVEVTTEGPERMEEAMAGGSISKRKEDAMRVLAPLAAELGLTTAELWAELVDINRAVLEEDWSQIRSMLAAVDDGGPYLRGTAKDGFTEGRLGVNIMMEWQPSVFLGVYLLPVDHKQPLLSPDDGGDFALILDVDRSEFFDGDAYAASDAFTSLRTRLARESGGWDFADHLAQKSPNRWHPLHLRRPLRSVLGGTKSREERKSRWMDAAREAAAILIRDKELCDVNGAAR